MREIVLDTETTGLFPEQGDRLVEIGCVELLNRIPTGQSFHAYINPERDMPMEAFRVHGLSAEFLADKPTFPGVADSFLAFIGDSPLVIHNAAFDAGFINAELGRLARPPLPHHRLVDTLMLARRKHPGKNSLDDLCARYGIDNAHRTKHGALLDAELLAEVYIELIGARQAQLVLGEVRIAVTAGAIDAVRLARPQPLMARGSEAERAAHAAFVAALGDKAIWKDYEAG